LNRIYNYHPLIFAHTCGASDSAAKRWNYFLLSVLIATLLAPNFPTLFANESYINLLFLLFSLFTLTIRRRPLQKEEALLIGFYFFMQLLLLISWANDIFLGRASLSDIASLLRPVPLALVPICFVHLLHCVGRHPVQVSDKFVSLSLIVILAYFFLDGLGLTDYFKYFLYERREKFFPYNYFISFFATSYFVAYFYFICFCYSVFKIFFGGGWLWFFFTIISLVFVIYAQSKVFYVLVFLVIALVAFIKFDSFGKILTLSIFFGLSILAFRMSANLGEVLSSVDLRGFRSMAHLISNLENYGSVSGRIEQILEAVALSFNSVGFGVGLGKGKMLESYLASFTYRYGLIGFALYSLFFLVIAKFSYNRLKVSVTSDDRMMFSFGSVWYLLLPIAMLSNPMYEMGKLAIFSSLILASILYCASGAFYKNAR
jgi:hypothetical protein